MLFLAFFWFADKVSAETYYPLTDKELELHVKHLIEKEFGTGTPMLKVAYCESKYKQFNKNGSVHRGKVNDLDAGIFQINEKYWLKESKKLGLDIHTIEGNIKMAKHIKEKQGMNAWKPSKNCWGRNYS